MHSLARPAAIALLLAGGAGASAAGLQPPEDIRAAAEQAARQLLAGIGPDGAAAQATVDPRLRLPACPMPLAARIAAGSQAGGRLAIEVSCAGPAWRVFVPVVLQARLAMVVAARPLPARTVLAAGDLRVVERDSAALPYGYLREPAEALGHELLRPLAPGEPVTPQAVRALPLVRRGQAVTVLARSGALSVRVQGEALAAAGLNEPVRVRNQSSGRNVEGIVRGPDLVEVPL